MNDVQRDTSDPGTPSRRNLRPSLRRADAWIVIKGVLFLCGWLLLVLNVGGLMLTLRSSKVHDPAMFFFPADVTLTVEEFWTEANRPARDDREMARRLTMAVNGVVLHYWDEDGKGTIPLRVPVWENYWLCLAAFAKPEIFHQYEFMNPEKAVERGVGLCSQQALILEQLLERRGIPAEIIGLGGHVVVAAKVSGGEGGEDEAGGAVEEWLLDPDYGVVIPHALAEIERNPERVRQYYLERGHTPEQADDLTQIFGPERNHRFASARAYYEHKYLFEKAAYVMKWAAPILMMIPWAVSYPRVMRKKFPNSAPAVG